MASQQSIIIWEKSAYCQTPDKGWVRAHLSKQDDAAAFIQENFKSGSSIQMLYDPDGMQTDFAECPGGLRVIVREALAASHEPITNMQTAWGYQPPWPIPGSGGSQGTFCSCEAIPQLYHLITSLSDVDRKISRAYPLITLAMLASASPGRTNLFLVVDQDSQAFVYLSTATGMRACRKINVGNRKDNFDVWADISMVLGEYGVSFDDGSQRPIVKVFQAPGTNIRTQCSYWTTLEQQAQVEVQDFSGLSLLLGNVPNKHTSSLTDDMPKTVSFDLGFKIASGVLAALLIGFGIYGYLDLDKQKAEIRRLETQKTTLQVQESKLTKNKTEIETMRKLYAQDVFEASKGRLKLISAMPAMIPREFTLTNVSVGTSGDTSFRINGVYWNYAIEGRGGNAQKPSANNPKSTANTATPITPVIKKLESGVQGLLVSNAPSSFNTTTGDFTIEGNTPQGDTVAAAAKPQAQPAPTAARPGPNQPKGGKK